MAAAQAVQGLRWIATHLKLLLNGEQAPRLGARRYALSGVGAFKACLRREWTLMTRHSFIYIFRTCQAGRLSTLSLSCWSRDSPAGGFCTSTSVDVKGVMLRWRVLPCAGQRGVDRDRDAVPAHHAPHLQHPGRPDVPGPAVLRHHPHGACGCWLSELPFSAALQQYCGMPTACPAHARISKHCHAFLRGYAKVATSQFVLTDSSVLLISGCQLQGQEVKQWFPASGSQPTWCTSPVEWHLVSAFWNSTDEALHPAHASCLDCMCHMCHKDRGTRARVVGPAQMFNAYSEMSIMVGTLSGLLQAARLLLLPGLGRQPARRAAAPALLLRGVPRALPHHLQHRRAGAGRGQVCAVRRLTSGRSTLQQPCDMWEMWRHITSPACPALSTVLVYEVGSM